MEQDFYRGPPGRAARHRRADTRPTTASLLPGDLRELCLGRIEARSRQAYRDVMQRLVERGAQGIILGCTQISMLVGEQDATFRCSTPRRFMPPPPGRVGAGGCRFSYASGAHVMSAGLPRTPPVHCCPVWLLLGAPVLYYGAESIQGARDTLDSRRCHTSRAPSSKHETRGRTYCSVPVIHYIRGARQGIQVSARVPDVEQCFSIPGCKPRSDNYPRPAVPCASL